MVIATVSPRFAYFAAAAIVRAKYYAESKADFTRGLASKRQSDLGYRPGTPGHAVVEGIKDIVETALASDVNVVKDGKLQTVDFPTNAKFDTDKAGNEVFVYHPIRDVRM